MKIEAYWKSFFYIKYISPIIGGVVTKDNTDHPSFQEALKK